MIPSSGTGVFSELNTKEHKVDAHVIRILVENRVLYYVDVVFRPREFNEISNSNHNHLAVASPFCMWSICLD